jgi:hypothetical protein
MGWKYRIWKWCFGFGLDISIDKSIRVRLLYNENFETVSQGLVIKERSFKRKRYMVLDDKEFVKVDDSGMYRIIFEFGSFSVKVSRKT